MLPNNTGNAANTVVTGGTTVALMAFFSSTMVKILPWLALALPLLVLDLIYGIKAARYRGDKIRFSTGLRCTVDKGVSYIMWVTAAVMFSSPELFDVAWLDKLILALVYGNEVISIIGNYLETKGISLSFSAIYKLIFKKGAEKVGVEITQEEVDSVLKDKPRDNKGRFVKK